MAPAELGDRPVHVTGTERQRQRDPQVAAQFAVLLSDGRLRLVEVGEDARAVLIEAPPGLGEIEPPGRAPQELHAQTLFERGHAAAHRRLRNAEALRGSGKAARLDDGDEGLQIAESAHIVAFCRTILSR